MNEPEDIAQNLVDAIYEDWKVEGFRFGVYRDDIVAPALAARDAEWQARVDAFLEDNNRSEEQVKKQFANAVSFKTRAEKAEARVDKLEAALKKIEAKGRSFIQNEAALDLSRMARSALGREV